MMSQYDIRGRGKAAAHIQWVQMQFDSEITYRTQRGSGGCLSYLKFIIRPS